MQAYESMNAMAELSNEAAAEDAGETSSDFEHSSASVVVAHKYKRRIAGGLVLVMLGAAVLAYIVPRKLNAVDTRTEGMAEQKYFTSGMENGICAKVYSGMYSPSGAACCDAGCGKYCGATNCQDGPGGHEACCTSSFKSVCTVGVKAPCTLRAKEKLVQKTQKCGAYGGIDHPGGNKCCDRMCGALCGAADCWKAGPGFKGCCGTHVDAYCSAKTATMAPCMLGVPRVTGDCATFGGLPHPSKEKCCGQGCGAKCGGRAQKCEQGEGGSSSCCGGLQGLPLCAAGSPAPCALVQASYRFAGIMGVTTPSKDTHKFATSAASRPACREALADVAGVDQAQITITGIAPGVPNTVGYEIVVPATSSLTATRLAQASPKHLASVLSTALAHSFLEENAYFSIESATIPKPAVTKLAETRMTEADAK